MKSLEKIIDSANRSLKLYTKYQERQRQIEKWQRAEESKRLYIKITYISVPALYETHSKSRIERIRIEGSASAIELLNTYKEIGHNLNMKKIEIVNEKGETFFKVNFTYRNGRQNWTI